MPIDRNEVATMIIDSLSALESYRRGVIGSELSDARERRTANETSLEGHVAQTEARSFDSLTHLLRLQLSQVRPIEYGITTSKTIIVEMELDSDVTRVILNPLFRIGMQGGPEAVFEFPPNDLRFLEEFRRGQNHALCMDTCYHRTENGLVIDYIRAF
jgi:hypothetical protein